MKQRAKPIKAHELLKRLEGDEAYQARMEAAKEQRNRMAAMHRAAEAPIIEELRATGYTVNTLDELRRSGARYASAIPILLKWLPLVTESSVKESIVRCLSVPWAKPEAAKPLIAAFRSASLNSAAGVKWTIANALEVVADKTVFTDLSELVRDPEHGKAREMLAVALGNINDPRAVEVLLTLLDDESIAGHAIMALGKLCAPQARARIERFLNHPKAWVRRQAERALQKIDHSHG